MRDLVDFISQYEPLYTKVVRGVSEERIVELEEALGRPLPKAYREFLSSVAGNMGFLTDDANFDIDPVICMVTERWESIPERFVPIAEDDGPTFYDYYLDFAHPQGEGDAMVVRISAQRPMLEEQLPVFRSLRDMIFSWAFTEVRMLLLPYKAQLLWLPPGSQNSMHAPSLEKLNEIMVNLGFSPLTITGPEAQLYERGNCAAAVYKAPYQASFVMRIAAKERLELVSAAENIRDAMPRYAQLRWI